MSSRMEEDAEPVQHNRDLKDILFQIGRDLSSDHVDRIKFLLYEKLPKTKQEKNVNIRQVFQTLEEMTLIKQSNPWLLIELLSKIGRDDLIADCFPCLSREAIHAKTPTGMLSTYRLKLYKVAMDLYEINIWELMDCFKVIPKSVQEKTRTSFDLFILLEEKRLIHKDDTSKLQTCLRDIGRRDSANDLQGLSGDVPYQSPTRTQETNQDFSIHHHSGASFGNPYCDSASCCGRSKISTSDAHLLAEAGLSVGKIGTYGTGFRVGSKYILTAAHVLKLAFGVNETTPISRDSLQDHLNRQGLKIDFKFASPHLANNRPISFPLKDITFYSDRHDMDFAIVELAPVNMKTPLPLPLKLFYDNQGSENEVIFHLLGHDRVSENQEIGLQCTTISSAAQFQEIYRNILARGVDVSLLSPFSNFGNIKELVQFHGTFKWGGSGSPGVLVRDGEPKVFTMLLRGHFEFPGIPENLKIQEGLRMWSIKETLRNYNSELCKDIFGDW